MKHAHLRFSSILWALFSALFVVAGAVQFNDPDTGRWVVLYWCAAAVAGCWPWRGRLPMRVGLGVLLLAFAVEIVSVLWGMLLVREVFAVGRIDLGVEVQREFGGLVVVAVAMSFAVSSARRARAAFMLGRKAKSVK
ncbi:MAG: hypothetical protein ACI89L_001517 [Phycisphaerales bacterium]|jgi:hypothetical protein